MDGISTQVIVAFSFGIIFIIVLMVIAVKFPNPTPFSYNVFRIVLSLAAAGIAAMLPGFINVELGKTTEIIIRAGGALAVFVIVYFYNPATLALHQESEEQLAERIPVTPDKLPSGELFPTNKTEAFNKVWHSLIALESSGQALWNLVSSETIATFAEELRNTKECVETHALFFSEEDYAALNQLLKTADFYLGGKKRLSKLYGEPISRKSPIFRSGLDPQIKRNILKEIRHNKGWLTRYRNLLSKIRNSLHTNAFQ